MTDTGASSITHRHIYFAGTLTITRIYEGTNQIQRMVMAQQLLKG